MSHCAAVSRHSSCKGISRNRQLGVSLITLMIGLLVSLIGVLGSMALYRNLIDTSVKASVDASSDGQISTLLLRAQLEVSDAGFGYEDPIAAGDLPHVVSDATGDAIYWRYKSPSIGITTCKAIIQTPLAPANERPLLEIKLLNQDVNCTDTVNLTSLNWADAAADANKSEILARLIDIDTDVGGAVVSRLAFNLVIEECMPFGLGTAQRRANLTIAATSSAKLLQDKSGVAGALSDITQSSCLPNAHYAAATLPTVAP